MAWVRSAIEVPSKPRSQKRSMAASKAASLSKLIGRPVFPVPVFIRLLATSILDCATVHPIRVRRIISVVTVPYYSTQSRRFKMDAFDGKLAVITGGNSGIGQV